MVFVRILRSGILQQRSVTLTFDLPCLVGEPTLTTSRKDELRRLDNESAITSLKATELRGQTAIYPDQASETASESEYCE
jgi:hypothetical protein